MNKNNLWKFAKKVTRQAITASGHALRIVGVLSIKSRIELNETLNINYVAYIVSGINKNCYLGLPFIKKYKHLIPFETAKVATNKVEEMKEVAPIDNIKDNKESIQEVNVKLTDSKGKEIPKSQIIDSVHFLRLLKNNAGGIMLVQSLDTEESTNKEIQIESVDIEIPLKGTEKIKDNILQEFKETVTNEAPKVLPPMRKIDHRIILVEENKPIFRQQYRLSFEERKELDQQVQELLAKGFIKPSNSPFNAPVLFVKKKDGTLRLCTDFRLLNNETIKDRFPLPRIDEILDTVSNAKIFSKLDLLSGYFQVRIKEEDIAKTAFSTPTGHYEWVVMPFGLSNAPSTFQRFMNQVLQPYLNKFVMVYLDDIVIYSNSVKEHQEHVKKVLQLLKENQLVAKLKKCAFFYEQISFLGFVIGNGKVKTDPGKIEKVKDWPTPKTIKECQSFLGLTGFYRRFIKDYSKVALPLTEFNCKKTEWGDKQDEAFQLLKEKLISAPVLQAPIFEDGYSFRLITDASDTCLGYVLEQLDPDGKLIGVVQYGSSKLHGAELNYPVREKEFLAVITALKKFRSYLLYRKFLICTDHHSLVYLKQQKQVNSGRLARWLDFLSQYEFDIQYIKGETNSAADALSRYPDASIESFDIFIEDTTVTQVVVNEELKQKLIDGYQGDDEFGEIYEVLSKSLPIPLEIKNHIKHFQIIDGLLYYKATQDEEFIRVCVPNVGYLKKDLIHQCHDSLTGGHFGAFKTYELLSRSFYWNKMIKTVRRYVNTCDSCQRNKPTNKAVQGLFRPLPIPSGRWTDVTLDFVGALPKTRTGYDTVMVVVDRLSKRAHFIPTKKTLSAEGAAMLFLDNIFKLHGVPKRLVSDKDVRFTAKFWRTIHAKLGTSILFSTTNHPQTDGQSERTIRTLTEYLRHYCNRDMMDWDKLLFAAEFSYNSTYQEGIKNCPFYVDLGYVPDGPSFLSSMPIRRYHSRAEDLANELKAILHSTQDQLVITQRDTEKQVNKHRTETNYNVGDLVLVHKDALVYQSSSTYNKLQPAYLGPYKLVKKLNDNAFEVDIPTHIKKHRTINVRWFKLYHPRDESYPKLPPNTHLEIMSRLSEITSIAGFDWDKRLVTVFWRDCPPGLSSTITYEEFDKIPLRLREALINQAQALGAQTTKKDAANALNVRIEDDSFQGEENVTE